MEWLALLVGTVAACGRGRRALLLENLVLRQQLAVLTRPTRRRPRLRRRDRVFWLVLSRLWRDWRRYVVVVQPDTVLRWHRRGWRLLWWWRSGRPAGRPRLPQEVRELIARLSRENRLWGTLRIRGELRTLGFQVSASSIRRYRWRDFPRRRSQTWGTFLRTHACTIWAADLFTVQTVAYKTLYVLFFITHGRRQLIDLAVTAHPTAAWVWRQLVEATPWGRRPTYLVRDHDRVYGGDFVARAKALGIETLLTPIRAPRANAIAERVVRTLRDECLDHVLILNERHLRAVLQEYMTYYNTQRPHRSLDLEPPLPTARAREPTAPIRARAILGGLHHVYERAA